MAQSVPVILAFALVLALPGQARADLVRLTNGRMMSVESVRFEGDIGRSWSSGAAGK